MKLVADARKPTPGRHLAVGVLELARGLVDRLEPVPKYVEDDAHYPTMSMSVLSVSLIVVKKRALAS